jgi:hypothetical protein
MMPAAAIAVIGLQPSPDPPIGGHFPAQVFISIFGLL